MNEWQSEQTEEKEIDILRLLQIIVKRAWLIILATVIFGLAAGLYSRLLITPTYRSSFSAYVNNRVASTEGANSTSSSDLNASIYLTYLYQDIIVSRSVLTEAAEICGLDIDYEQVKGKVSTKVASDAALITVYVTDTDPARATQLAQAIAEVAPAQVTRIVDGSSMRIVDSPVEPTTKYAPSNTKNALLGAVVGFVLSLVVVVTVDLLNDRVRDAEDLERRHGVIVIGTIPDLTSGDKPGDVYGKAGRQA